jgi:class 3 adenylate cyclase/tetratricopeptide (TPR) repeat protein
MRCSQCRHDNPQDAIFCNACGTRLEHRCPACGRDNPAGSRFCNDCERSLRSSFEQPGRLSSPESYTSEHVVERLITARTGLEGERKQVTVLFADLKGSMELLADRDPEEARTLLDPVLELMMEAVHRYEGTVNQVMGDGIMALFGAPIAQENHAVRACYAAVMMQELVKRYAEHVHQTKSIAVDIRVGLNSGGVVVRSIGGDLRMDYTAVGQTTHLAARMEQVASAGSVFMTATTLRLAEGYVNARALGALRVKGLEEAVEVFELVGVGAARSRLQAAAARGLTRFVGREAELAVLHQAREHARAGRGQVVAVVGEPGVGKSRLVWEFTRSHHARGWVILESMSPSHAKSPPYLPVIDLLRGYFGIQDRDDHDRIRERVTGKLVSLDRTLEHLAPWILALLDVPIDDGEWRTLDPSQRRQRTLDAVTRLLLRESREHPLILVFEDLHWVDSESQALLDGLVESLSTARVLLLVSYRPEYRHQWDAKAYYSRIRVDPLPPESADALLDALLGTDPSLADLKQLLVARTQSNPFFVEESVRELVESGALLGIPGAYRLTRPTQPVQVPASVQAVLASRIDRLPAEEKRLLQSASVIGKEVQFRLLAAIADLPEGALISALARLRATDFLYDVGLFPDREYTFKHALTHEVAYGGLLRDQKRMLHARIVHAIETLYPERLGDQVGRLAHHAVRAEAWDKAVVYLRQAAEKAAERSAHRAVASFLEEALVALRRLPETPETTRQNVDVRFAIRNSLFALGEHARIQAHLEEAQRLAQASGDEGRLAWAAVYMSNYFWREGDPDQAVALGQQALGIAEQRGDLPLKITAGLRLGQGYHALGDYRRAAKRLRENLLLIPGQLSRSTFGLAGLPSVFSRAFLAWSLAELGEFGEGIVHGKEALSIATKANQVYSRCIAHFALGFLYLQRGEPGRALRVLGSGLTVAERGQILAMRAMFLAALGHAHTLCARPDQALDLAEQSVEPSTFALSPQHPFPLLFLAAARLEAGLVERSAETAREALQLCRTRRDLGAEAWTLHLLGNIGSFRRPRDLEPVQRHYCQAMALAVRLAMRPLIAHCHFGLGRLHACLGDRTQADEHTGVAASMYRQMGMTYWIERAAR